MMRENSRSADEAAIRAVVDAMTKAVHAKSVDAMLAHCAPDIAGFDMVPPLKHRGAEAIRSNWAAALAQFSGRIECEVAQLEIMADGDVAFCRSLNRFGGTRVDGRHVANWLCSTMGFRKIEGQWKVVHGHVSVPFDMETGKAMLDLRP